MYVNHCSDEDPYFPLMALSWGKFEKSISFVWQTVDIQNDTFGCQIRPRLAKLRYGRG